MNRILSGKQIPSKASFYSLSVILGLSTAIFGFAPGIAAAGSLNQTTVRFDRLQTSQATTGTVCAKASTVATEASVQVAFPTGYTVNALGNWVVNTTNLSWPTGGTAWPGINTATNVTSQTVTFPSGDLTVGTLYCFNWTNSAAVSVKSSATSNNTGTVTTQTSLPATIDTAPYGTVSLSGDQVNVTASVPQAFTYALSATSDALGALTSGSVTSSPTPRTLTINTNASTGWVAWAQDSSTGLHSNAGSYTVPSTTPGANSTISGSTEGYNMGVTSTQTSGSGTIAVAAPFVGGTSGKGGGLDTTLRSIASSTGTANNAVLTLTNNATISSLTAAATDYSDTITLPAAA
ncbi:MAG TPA: hypothetical protein VLH38_04250, partial [Patescibacteria group bacterium]|nr:hypothetical protein [Patescibacteria group bacterium]